jgi:hypothetical protein
MQVLRRRILWCILLHPGSHFSLAFIKAFYKRYSVKMKSYKLKFSQKMLHPSKIGTSFEKDPIYILKFLEFGKIHPQNPLDNRVICKVTLSTFTPPYPLFQRYPQSKEI